jgi:hypothetical protein
MRTHTEKITVQLSPTERRMLEHLAMAERVPRTFIVRRLIRDAASELYEIVEAARRPDGDRRQVDNQGQQEVKDV